MTSRRARRSAAGQTVHGIDRMVRNVQTGHFERSLSALTAAGALVTAAEIYFEHDSASGLRIQVRVAGSKRNLEDGATKLSHNRRRALPGKEIRCISVSGR